MNKKWAALGVSLGVIGGGAAGFLATSSSSPAGAGGVVAPAQEATDTTVAGQPGEAGDERDHDHADRLGEILAPLVEDGTITQAQADAVIGALTEAMPMGRGHGGGMGRGPGFGGPRLDELVEGLGLSVEEIMEALRDGTSIAELAEQQGVDLQGVIDAGLAEVKAHLDEEVAEGDLTQAEADARLAEATEKITAFVEGDLTFPMGGKGGWGRHGGHHGDDGPANTDGATTTTLG